jgi:hypothetical protein
MDNKNINQHFASLVLSLAATAWNQMGKVPSPISGKIEKNLDNVAMTIDILVMVKEKTISNLTPEEERLLTNTIADLQMNYADEINNKGNNPETVH